MTLKDLLVTVKNNAWRGVVVFQGTKTWCRAHYLSFFSSVNGSPFEGVPEVCFIDNDHEHSVCAKQLNTLLGNEYDLVIYNFADARDVNMLAASAGLVKAGGLLVLFLPNQEPNQTWHQQATKKTGAQDFFLQRLNACLGKMEHCVWVHENTDQNSVANCWQQVKDTYDGYITIQKANNESVNKEVGGFVECAYDEQLLAIASIEAAIVGRKKRPLLIIADRGRGKSASLAIATKKTLSKVGQTISVGVTARSRQQLNVFFKHLQYSELTKISENAYGFAKSTVQFYALDDLILHEKNINCLLIDEAASIPIFQLQTLLEKYKRCVFTTTSHGYEGSGRGFELRFLQYLENHYPQHKRLKLTAPLRWAEHDPLEHFINQLFLLKVNLPQYTVDPVKIDQLRVLPLSPEQLSQDEKLLSSCFTLLNHAHYRTSPRDFEQLLNAQDVARYVLIYKGEVAAVCLLRIEMPIDQTLACGVIAGKRRIKGNMLMQQLLQLTGDITWSNAPMARIMRIAVHPQLQKMGIGSTFLLQLKQRLLNEHGITQLGTVFGATPELIRFWQKNDYYPFRIGHQQQLSSGECSVSLLHANVDAENSSAVSSLQFQFLKQLPIQIAHHSRMLIELLPALLANLPTNITLTVADNMQIDFKQIDTKQITRFVNGQLPFELALVHLHAFYQRFYLLPVARNNELMDNNNIRFIALLFWRQATWAQCAQLLGLSGKKAVIEHLKRITHLALVN